MATDLPRPPGPSSTRSVLVLGGTGWLGGLIATKMRAAGWAVTCLARGRSGSAPAGVEMVRADRSEPDALDAVRGRHWRAVIDLTRQPGQASAAALALRSAAQMCLFISSCSAYRDHSLPGADESAPLLAPLGTEHLTDPADYGAAKVACELAWQQSFGSDRSLVVRPGLIAGPGDTSDRTGYWPARMAEPADQGSAEVLIPQGPGQVAQVVDARDLADWIALLVARGQVGCFDAVGLSIPLAEHLQTAWVAGGRRAKTLEVPDSWLLAQGVAPWSGPKSLPLWLPDPAMAGFASRSGQAARDAGLALRPLIATLSDTLAWERMRLARPVRLAGLTPAEEVGLIQAWHSN